MPHSLWELRPVINYLESLSIQQGAALRGCGGQPSVHAHTVSSRALPKSPHRRQVSGVHSWCPLSSKSSQVLSAYRPCPPLHGGDTFSQHQIEKFPAMACKWTH